MQILTWNLRTSRGLTLEQMAEITGISKTTLNDIENGKVSPRLDIMERIAKTMDVRISDLYDSEFK